MVRRFERIRALRWFVRTLKSRETQSNPNIGPVSLNRQLSLALRGFLPDKHACYQFDENDWRLYVSDLQMLRSSFINRQYGVIVDDKVLFASIIGKYASVPENFVLIQKGKPNWIGSAADETSSLPELVRQKQALIAKPAMAAGGAGVLLLEFRDGGFLRNGEPIDEASLNWQSLGTPDTIVTEYIKQGSFANGLYPGSVNTIRFLTMQDPDTQFPFIADAAIRVGCDASAPVDNVSAGGLICNIDAGTGRLSKAVLGYSLNGPVRRVERHPDNGIIFEDQVIPGWESIREQTVALAAKLPMLPYIAWDLATLDQGIVVIEANGWSQLASMQMRRPFLTNPRIRRFFEHHNVL